MPVCSNYDCMNTPFGTKVRCGICRQKALYTCCDCGAELNLGGLDNGRRVCPECTIMHKKESIEKRPGERDDQCIICFKPVARRKKMFCESSECFRIHRNMDTPMRKGKTVIA